MVTPTKLHRPRKDWPPYKMRYLEQSLGMSPIDYIAEALIADRATHGTIVRWLEEDGGVSIDRGTLRDWIQQARVTNPEAFERAKELAEDRRRFARACDIEHQAQLREIECVRAATEGRHCRVCGGPIPLSSRRPDGVSCSPECAELWRTCRFHLDADEHAKHRKQIARAALRTGKSPQNHYRAVLVGEPTRDHGRWTTSAVQRERLERIASLRAEALRRWGTLAAPRPPLRALEKERRRGPATSTCESCGKTFAVNRWAKGRFCSQLCYRTAGTGRRAS